MLPGCSLVKQFDSISYEPENFTTPPIGNIDKVIGESLHAKTLGAPGLVSTPPL